MIDGHASTDQPRQARFNLDLKICYYLQCVNIELFLSIQPSVYQQNEGHHCSKVTPFFFCMGSDFRRITPPAQGRAQGSARLLLTKNPACSFSCPVKVGRCPVSRLNGSRGPGRSLWIDLCGCYLQCVKSHKFTNKIRVSTIRR